MKDILDKFISDKFEGLEQKASSFVSWKRKKC